MKTKKPTLKNSLEYARPSYGEFEIKSFPNFTFKFRKITIDDEAWVTETFGMTVWAFVHQASATAADLCRLWFHFLSDESKAQFPYEETEVPDYDNGGVKKEVLTGPRKLMRAIDGGSLTEVLIISHAFAKTLASSRPMDDMPEDLKKNLLAMEKRHAEKAKSEPTPEK